MTTILKQRPNEWSNSYLVDKLKQHLATIELSKSKIETDLLNSGGERFNTYFCLISNRHYVNQAFHYLKIGILDRLQSFWSAYQI